jgi:uncharacterized phage protein (TIGR01671 family)
MSEKEREIKFRAWDKLKNQFMRDGEIAFLYSGENRIEVRPSYGYDNDPDFLGEVTKNRFALLQFTGLKDKNGKEIYEGDIVKYYDSYGVWLTSKIIDTGLAFAIETDNNPILLYEFSEDYIYDGKPAQGIEVIGNIYENPELLNKKEEI